MEEMATYTTSGDPDYSVPDEWHKMPMWKKRLVGWFVYQRASFFAIFKPVYTDTAMFRILCKRFLAPGTYVLSWDISRGQDVSSWIKARYNYSGSIEILAAGSWGEFEKECSDEKTKS